MAYLKPALAFAILRESLGAETFDAALRTFMLRWEGKHPLPWDFFHTFNEVAGESLNWFWSPWFFEPGYPDLAIAKVEEEEGGSVVTVRRVGSMPVPVHMQMTLENGATEDVVKTAAIWKDGGAVAQFRVAHAARLASVRIGASWIPDANPTDNTWKQ
jgi:aminopeptidase N